MEAAANMAVHKSAGEIDCVCVCVRVPKSGSASLSEMLRAGFAGRRTFYMPNTLDPDATFSAFQRHRGARSRRRNLFKHYRSIGMEHVYRLIAREAKQGDLIDGGHIDFRTVSSRIPLRLKMITLVREPVARVLSEYNYSRQGYFKKPWFNRFDAGVLHKAAARLSFAGYLDFLIEHRELWGDIASTYVGWDGAEELSALFARNVFHAGVLEDSGRFAAGLSQKLGVPLALPHENRTGITATREVTAAERARIERLYARDFTLYQWVRERA